MSPTDATTSTGSSPLKNSLGEAGGHLKQAARDAGDAIKGATGAAGDELRIGKAHVKSDLADSALAGITAAEQASAAARDQVAALVHQHVGLFAAGWIIAKLARSGDK